MALWTPLAPAAEAGSTAASHLEQTSILRALGRNASGLPHPGTPMMLAPAHGLPSFDLGGSETRKLQLQLTDPLWVEAGNQLHTSTGFTLLEMDGSVNVAVGPRASLAASAEQSLVRAPFQALGSIQCLNGTLRADSYTASECRFVDDTAASFDRRTLSLGAAYGFDHLAGSLNWFTSSADAGPGDVRKANQFNATHLLDHRSFLNSPDPGWLTGPMPSRFDRSEISGIDLNFRLGFTTDQTGEVRLGLALARVFEAEYSGVYGSRLGATDWSLAEPFNQATLGVEWTKGNFSSGIRGYYHEPISFLDRHQLDSMGTFDVHFTWRTPWNANLSVGASNVLNAGAEDNQAADKPVDRFESIYGRIPYVRYQQDL